MIMHGFSDGGGLRSGYIFYCPGCDEPHGVYVYIPNEGGHQWGFNGNMQAPTFSPSIVVAAVDGHPRCHSFVRDGEIEFLADSTHRLAGRKVPLPDLDRELSIEDAPPVAGGPIAV